MVKAKQGEKIEGEFETIETKPRTMEVGETIVGTFVGTRPGKFGDVFMLDNDSGERYNIYGGQQFEATLTPDKVGRTFRIKHLGKEKTSKGWSVRTYKFQIKREKVE